MVGKHKRLQGSCPSEAAARLSLNVRLAGRWNVPHCSERERDNACWRKQIADSLEKAFTSGWTCRPDANCAGTRLDRLWNTKLGSKSMPLYTHVSFKTMPLHKHVSFCPLRPCSNLVSPKRVCGTLSGKPKENGTLSGPCRDLVGTWSPFSFVNRKYGNVDVVQHHK